nr:hypothetical protein [Tanacetum cinerariifolium]GEW50336.1 hypothetical protein [Tanacetum cinerariifolium]
MTHLVASITLDSATSCMMQGAFLRQGTVSSIPTVLSWGGSIGPEGFWPSILLLTVIIVTVAVVVVVVLVIVDTIIGIVIVVVGAPSIIKLVFVITGVSLGLVFLLRLSILSMVAACDSSIAVKDKQEKDKIGTKPNKNEKRRKAWQSQSPVTVKKAEKEKKIQTKGTKNGKP